MRTLPNIQWVCLLLCCLRKHHLFPRRVILYIQRAASKFYLLFSFQQKITAVNKNDIRGPAFIEVLITVYSQMKIMIITSSPSQGEMWHIKTSFTRLTTWIPLDQPVLPVKSCKSVTSWGAPLVTSDLYSERTTEWACASVPFPPSWHLKRSCFLLMNTQKKSAVCHLYLNSAHSRRRRRRRERAGGRVWGISKKKENTFKLREWGEIFRHKVASLSL